MMVAPELFMTLSSVARTLAGTLAAPTIQAVALRELNKNPFYETFWVPPALHQELKSSSCPSPIGRFLPAIKRYPRRRPRGRSNVR